MWTRDAISSGRPDSRERKVRLGEIVHDSVKSISKMLSSIQQKYAKRTPSTGLVHLALEDEEIIKTCLKFDPKVNDEDVQNVYSGNFPTYEYIRCTSSSKTYWNKRDRADMHSYFEQFGTFSLHFGLQPKFENMDDFRKYVCNERHMEDYQLQKICFEAERMENFCTTGLCVAKDQGRP